MTRLASGWEKLRLRRVTGVRGVVVIRLMTSDARRRQRRKVVVDVTIGTLPRRHRVRAGQRERCVVVVKRGIGPYGRVVTKFTCGRETGGRVSWIVRSGIIRLVARVTQSAIERIVVVLVAITAQAWRHRMRTGQGEPSGGVVEGSIRPGDSVVARRTGRWEAAVRHRTGCGPIVRLVAAVTGGRQRGEVAVGMAIRASSRRHRMRSRQWERGVVVIEGRIAPLHRVVACLACRWEPGVRHRTGCACEIFLVTRYAKGAVQRVVVVDVAIGAQPGRHCVRTSKRKSGARVIKLSVSPLDGVVALFAGGRKSAMRNWTRGSCIVFRVARNAGCNRDVVVIAAVAIGTLPRRDRMRSG